VKEKQGDLIALCGSHKAVLTGSKIWSTTSRQKAWEY